MLINSLNLLTFYQLIICQSNSSSTINRYTEKNIYNIPTSWECQCDPKDPNKLLTFVLMLDRVPDVGKLAIFKEEEVVLLC